MTFLVELEDAEALFPEYEFVERLTESVQKAAFHVRDSDGNDLCLKIIAPNYGRDRLDREISALRKLSHPNVVRLIAYEDSSTADPPRHYATEEFIAGTDLTNCLSPENPWNLRQASEFFIALCGGLDEIGKRRIVHRDLKPSNIRVRPDGSPVIIDFGVARHLLEPDLTSTAQGAQIGTLQYFSPEQCEGTKHEIDHRTDLFAMGVILFEAVTGSHPFWDPADNKSDLIEKICRSEKFRDNEIFGSLQRNWQLLIEKLLSKERGRRPPRAEQVRRILIKIGQNA